MSASSSSGSAAAAATARQPRYEELTAENLVCQASLGMRNLNMAAIAQALSARFGYKSFPACSSRCRNTGTVNIIFGTGAMIIVGAKDLPSAVLSGQLLVNRLRRDLGLNVGLYNVTQVWVMTPSYSSMRCSLCMLTLL